MRRPRNLHIFPYLTTKIIQLVVTHSIIIFFIPILQQLHPSTTKLCFTSSHISIVFSYYHRIYIFRFQFPHRVSVATIPWSWKVLSQSSLEAIHRLVVEPSFPELSSKSTPPRVMCPEIAFITSVFASTMKT